MPSRSMIDRRGEAFAINRVYRALKPFGPAARPVVPLDSSRAADPKGLEIPV